MRGVEDCGTPLICLFPEKFEETLACIKVKICSDFIKYVNLLLLSKTLEQ
jgi:hypothetical protein